VYATPVSGVPDVVMEGETGFSMTEESHDRIVSRITHGLNDGGLHEMSRSCRTLIEEEYSFEAAVERYRRLFERVAQ